MATFHCKSCGAPLNVLEGKSVVQCEYCFVNQTVSLTNDESVSLLFNKAVELRLECEFDKAEQVFDRILELNKNDSEAHWGILLCKYGIEYVVDPKNGKRVPTCHRTLYESILDDPHYAAVIANANALQKEVYEQDANTINEIQKSILRIVANEKPFDVFISYKDTDNGQKTVDSTIANDLYYQLTEEGLKVFYAPITLNERVVGEYEPYIFAALNSAKIMITLATKREYFDAVWVKNEWSRFLKLSRGDRKKRLLPCYRDMDPYDLPVEFSLLQKYDMGKISFIVDLVKGIKKELHPENEATVSSAPSNSVAPLLKRAALFLEDKNWQSADEYCEKVLDIDPENGEAYLYKLMADMKVSKVDGLASCAEPFDTDINFGKVLRFADSEVGARIKGYSDAIRDRNKLRRDEETYQKAMALYNNSDYNEVAKSYPLFKQIAGYKDSAELLEKVPYKADSMRKQTIIDSHISALSSSDKYEKERAISMLRVLDGFGDSTKIIKQLEAQVAEIEAQEELARKAEQERQEKARKAEEERRERERLEAERKAEQARIAAVKLKKKRFIASVIKIAAALVAVAIIGSIIYVKGFKEPNEKYAEAVMLLENGEYDEAIALFEDLGKRKDSQEKVLEAKYGKAGVLAENGEYEQALEVYAELIEKSYLDSKEKRAEIVVNNPKFADVGDIVTFGAYEQDNDTANGKEAIEWLVVAKEDDGITLISTIGLDYKPYAEKSNGYHVDWKDCSLRKWLNNEFLGAAFTAEEQEKLLMPELKTGDNVTSDKVFLLDAYSAPEPPLAAADEISAYARAMSEKESLIYAAKPSNPEYWTRAHSSGGGAMVRDNYSFGSLWTYAPAFVRPSIKIQFN